MFITNKHNVNEQPGEESTMSSRLREVIPDTETLSILSGYFYFNGIPPLMEPIASNGELKLRILVGLDVDRMGYELARAGDGETAQGADADCKTVGGLADGEQSGGVGWCHVFSPSLLFSLPC